MPKVPASPMSVPRDPFAGLDPNLVVMAEFEQIAKRQKEQKEPKDDR